MTEAFLKVVNMSISAGWLVLAVLVLRLLLKKAPKWVNVLLWGIVAVRLICPFSIESALSLIPSAETFPDKVISGPSFDVQTGIAPVDNRINDYLDDRYFEGVTVPENNGSNVMTVLMIVWIIGILLLVAYTVISYQQLHRKVDTAVLYKDNIFQSENVASPFVLGIIKPKIYLPYTISEQDMAHVIAHEQAHIRRKDHWWKPLGFLLLTIHWFNPLMWAAYFLLCRDIELACDEKVIKELGNEQRAEYSQALVACSVNRRVIAACPLAFGEVGVKDRVKSIMNYRKPTFWIVVFAIAACIVVSVCFLTDPPMVKLDDLPVVHSHSYGITEVTYESFNDKVPDMDKIAGLRFRITENMEFGIKSDAISDTEWTCLGTLAEVKLTKENFDHIFYHDDGWVKGESAATIRRNAANSWALVLEETEQFYYLIQMNNGELFLAEGYYDTAEKNDPGSDDTSVSLLYRIAVDLNEDYNIVAKSGENTISVSIFPAGSAIGSFKNSIQWLTVAPGDDPVPFRTYQNGEEISCYFNAFDAETFEPVQSHILSDTDPQTYLFENAEPGRDYIVVMMLSTDPDAPIYTFGVHYVPEQNGILRAKILEIHDGYFLVEPLEGSWERNSADRIEVPMNHMSSSLEPRVGDILQIEYDGQIQETYPARITNVFGITLQRTDDTAAMVPTDTDLLGSQAGALLVPINGNIYRYELTEGDPQGVTADELLYTFTEETNIEGIVWEVYSLKEYPDKSSVLMISGTNSSWLCRYNPPGRCADTALADAINADYVVMQDGIATHGQDIWKEFYDLTLQGMAASVTVAQYGTLDPDRCDSVLYEIFNQDYPYLSVYQLSYDGKTYTLSFVDGNELHIRNYEYLMKYDTSDFYSSSSTLPQGRYDYVLTHDNHVTWEQLWNGLVSSQMGAYIDHYSIYAEGKQYKIDIDGFYQPVYRFEAASDEGSYADRIMLPAMR